MRLALAGEGGTEAKRGDTDGDPAELVRDTDETVGGAVSDLCISKRWGKISEHHLLLQPVPKLACANEAGAEAETRNKTSSEDGDPRHLVSVERAKYFGCMALHGQRVQQSRSGEQGVVTS